jgi:hypothetical protein
MSAARELTGFPGEDAMDPYEEEQLAIDQAAAAAELSMALEEGVEKGWFYAVDDANGGRAYGLTEEGRRAMARGELG